MKKKSFKDKVPAHAFINTGEELEQESKEAEDNKAEEIMDSPSDKESYIEEGKKEQKKTKKKKKRPRINMAYDEENMDYIKVMSRVKGVSMTEFNNMVLKEHMEKNRDIFEKMKELMMEGE